MFKAIADASLQSIFLNRKWGGVGHAFGQQTSLKATTLKLALWKHCGN